MKLEFYGHMLERYPNMKFHESPPIGRRDVSCGPTDIMKLTFAFRNFVNTLNKELFMWWPFPSVLWCIRALPNTSD